VRPTVLLLHAFPLDARMWDAQVAALENEGYRVLAPTLPGRTLDASLESWAERVVDLVPDSFVPVGVSMGGYLIFELWRRAAARIPALVLADTRAEADSDEAREGRERTIRLLEDGGFEPFWDDLAPKLFSSSSTREVVASARAIAAEQPIPALVATQRALGARPDSTETLETITAPTLVLVGEEDAITPPSAAEAMLLRLPSARLDRVAAAGHLAPLERPAEFNEAVLDFLAGNA
jgi:pimeloyl-ACP methyl ester carboxylesterase